MQNKETIPHGADPEEARERVVQVRLPELIARRAKARAAEDGQTLQQFVRAAVEEKLGIGKAA